MRYFERTRKAVLLADWSWYGIVSYLNILRNFTEEKVIAIFILDIWLARSPSSGKNWRRRIQTRKKGF